MPATKDNFKCFQWRGSRTIQDASTWDTGYTDLCRQFVNYPFIMFDNSSVEKLNTEIMNRLLQLHASSIYIPSSTCMAALMRATCAGVYLRCTDTTVAKLGVFDDEGQKGKLGTLSTMGYANVFLNHSDHFRGNWGSHTSLPFLRPCIATCHRVEECCGHSVVSMIAHSVTASSRAGVGWWLSCSTARADYSMFPPVWYGSGSSSSLLESHRYPHAYDLSDNVSSCYNMSLWVWDWRNSSAWSIFSNSSLTMLQSMPPSRDAETYIHDNYGGNGICSGIVSELYVPYKFCINGSDVILPQALPAYMFQAILEREVRSLLSLMPGWVSEECYGSLRKLVCASRLLRPERQVVREILAANGYDVGSIASVWQSRLNVTAAEAQSLLNASFYAPSYPHRSLCTDYVDVCGSFAARLQRTKGISVFVANCNVSIGTSDRSCAGELSALTEYSSVVIDAGLLGLLRGYPIVGQAVMSIPFFNDTGSNVSWAAVFTSPNELSGISDAMAVGSYYTQCPYGSVVPDDKSHPRNVWKQGTGCAQACRLGVWSIHEYEMLDNIMFDGSIVSVIMSGIVAVYWVSEKSRRKRYFLLSVFVCLTPLYAFVYLIPFFAGSTAEQRFCLNNAVPLQLSDGLTACVVSSMLNTYITLAVSFTWLLEAVELFQKFVLRRKRSWCRSYTIYIQGVLIFIVPGVWVAIGARKGVFGYSGYQPICFVAYGVQAYVGTILTQGLVLITVVIGGALMASVLARLSWKLFRARRIWSIGGSPAAGRPGSVDRPQQLQRKQQQSHERQSQEEVLRVCHLTFNSPGTMSPQREPRDGAFSPPCELNLGGDAGWVCADKEEERKDHADTDADAAGGPRRVVDMLKPLNTDAEDALPEPDDKGNAKNPRGSAYGQIGWRRNMHAARNPHDSSVRLSVTAIQELQRHSVSPRPASRGPSHTQPQPQPQPQPHRQSQSPLQQQQLPRPQSPRSQRQQRKGMVTRASKPLPGRRQGDVAAAAAGADMSEESLLVRGCRLISSKELNRIVGGPFEHLSSCGGPSNAIMSGDAGSIPSNLADIGSEKSVVMTRGGLQEADLEDHIESSPINLRRASSAVTRDGKGSMGGARMRSGEKRSWGPSGSSWKRRSRVVADDETNADGRIAERHEGAHSIDAIFPARLPFPDDDLVIGTLDRQIHAISPAGRVITNQSIVPAGIFAGAGEEAGDSGPLDVYATYNRFRMSIIRANISIFIFTVVYMVCFLCFIVYSVFVLVHKSDADTQYEEWTECAFVHFEALHPLSWMDVCGSAPPHRIPLLLTVVAFTALAYYGAFMSSKHFLSIARSLTTLSSWRGCLECILDALECFFGFIADKIFPDESRGGDGWSLPIPANGAAAGGGVGGRGVRNMSSSMLAALRQILARRADSGRVGNP